MQDANTLFIAATQAFCRAMQQALESDIKKAKSFDFSNRLRQAQLERAYPEICSKESAQAFLNTIGHMGFSNEADRIKKSWLEKSTTSEDYTLFKRRLDAQHKLNSSQKRVLLLLESLLSGAYSVLYGVRTTAIILTLWLGITITLSHNIVLVAVALILARIVIQTMQAKHNNPYQGVQTVHALQILSTLLTATIMMLSFLFPSPIALLVFSIVAVIADLSLALTIDMVRICSNQKRSFFQALTTAMLNKLSINNPDNPEHAWNTTVFWTSFIISTIFIITTSCTLYGFTLLAPIPMIGSFALGLAILTKKLHHLFTQPTESKPQQTHMDSTPTNEAERFRARNDHALAKRNKAKINETIKSDDSLRP